MKIDRSKLPYYICGPMTGKPQFNYPLFEAVTEVVRQRNARGAISPAEMDSDVMRAHALASKTGDLAAIEKASGETWGDVLARDVRLIEQKIGGFMLLPGWQKSRGAKLEVFVGLLVGITEFYEVYEELDAFNGPFQFWQRGTDYIRQTIRENMP